MFIIIPPASDFREHRPEIHREGNGNILIFEADDPPVDTHGLELAEGERAMINAAQNKIFGYFESIQKVAGERARELPIEKGNLISRRLKLLTLLAESLKRKGKGGPGAGITRGSSHNVYKALFFRDGMETLVAETPEESRSRSGFSVW